MPSLHVSCIVRSWSPRYGGGRLERLRILKHSADELLGIVVHRHNVVQIDKGSPAERAQVAVGDNLIAVNGRDLRGLDHDEIVAVLQEKGTLRQQVRIFHCTVVYLDSKSGLPS